MASSFSTWSGFVSKSDGGPSTWLRFSFGAALSQPEKGGSDPKTEHTVWRRVLPCPAPWSSGCGCWSWIAMRKHHEQCERSTLCSPLRLAPCRTSEVQARNGQISAPTMTSLQKPQRRNKQFTKFVIRPGACRGSRPWEQAPKP